jgi:CheY-like chemotaxis protein
VCRGYSPSEQALFAVPRGEGLIAVDEKHCASSMRLAWTTWFADDQHDARLTRNEDDALLRRQMNRLPTSPLISKGLEIAERHLGIGELSRRLAATEMTIRAWRFGDAQMAESDFLRLVDILTAIDPKWTDRVNQGTHSRRIATVAKRVLVVDDHPDTAMTTAALLQALGHQPRFVLDPREAVGIARSFRPQVALLDLTMPHLDGIALARMFRSDPDLKSTCLIAVTAYDDPKHRAMTREAGFDAHLGKPVDELILASLIAQFE